MWWQEVEQKLRSDRVLTNCFGRRRFVMGLISDEVIREGIAFEPQSTVGDLLNFSISDVWDDEELISEIDLLLQIHDALMWQGPPGTKQYQSETIAKHMAIPLTINGRTFTIPTDFSWGPSWGELVEE